MTTKTTILLVLCGNTSPLAQREFGDYDALFLAGLGHLKGHLIKVVQAHRYEELPSPEEQCAVIISGSRSMVTEQAPWMETLAHWLRGAIRAELPLLAVCFGHQLLAQAFGGQVGPSPMGPEYGMHPVCPSAVAANDPLWGPLFTDGPLMVAEQHYQNVLRPPSEATVLATSPKDPYHVLRYHKRAWSMQFHPESTTPLLERVVRNEATSLGEFGEDPEALLAGLHAGNQGSHVLQSFAQLCGLSAP